VVSHDELHLHELRYSGFTEGKWGGGRSRKGGAWHCVIRPRISEPITRRKSAIITDRPQESQQGVEEPRYPACARLGIPAGYDAEEVRDCYFLHGGLLGLSRDGKNSRGSSDRRKR
jgi:hypothetical protein